MCALAVREEWALGLPRVYVEEKFPPTEDCDWPDPLLGV